MVISIHALREESDPTTKKLVLAVRFISIHALREESDLFICIVGKPADGFQSTLSVRRATEYDGQANTWLLISIHALREESDVVSLLMYSILFIFQSTLSVRRTTWRTATIIKLSLFQSTLSVRRATFFSQVECILFDISIHALREESDRIWRASKYLITYFNPRSPWGERLLKVVCTVCPIRISIHALREESDLLILVIWALKSIFQSTLSVRRATL